MSGHRSTTAEFRHSMSAGGRVGVADPQLPSAGRTGLPSLPGPGPVVVVTAGGRCVVGVGAPPVEGAGVVGSCPVADVVGLCPGLVGVGCWPGRVERSAGVVGESLLEGPPSPR